MRPTHRLLAVIAVATTLSVGCSGSPSKVSVASTNPTASTTADSASGSEVTAPIDGVKTFEIGKYTHEPLDVTPTYPMSPPVGGDHADPPGWQNCGAYAEPVPNQFAVHSLEHGAVWITYRPDLPPAEVATLQALVTGRTHLLVSPYPDLQAPVVVNAWGAQLELTSVDDPRLLAFIERYYLGGTSPEPGARCTGGQGTPL